MRTFRAENIGFFKICGCPHRQEGVEPMRTSGRERGVNLSRDCADGPKLIYYR